MNNFITLWNVERNYFSINYFTFIDLKNKFLKNFNKLFFTHLTVRKVIWKRIVSKKKLFFAILTDHILRKKSYKKTTNSQLTSYCMIKMNFNPLTFFFSGVLNFLGIPIFNLLTLIQSPTCLWGKIM